MHCLAVIPTRRRALGESVELEESATGLVLSATRACRFRRVPLAQCPRGSRAGAFAARAAARAAENRAARVERRCAGGTPPA